MAHIRKRGKKKWQIIIEKERNPVTGKRRRKYKTVNGTKSEAKKVMRQMVYEMENGIAIEPSKMTVAEFLRQWLSDYCKPNLAPRSYESYKMIVEKHLIPELGNIKLKKLKPFHIQSYQSKKLSSGRRDGKKGGLSNTTVNRHNTLLSSALNYAVRMQMLPKNPAKAVKPPREDNREMVVLNEDQIKKLLDNCEDDWIYNIIYFSVNTGMRRGEVIGLRWKDVEFNNKVVRVNQICQRIRNKGIIFKEPKTQASRRSIAISRDLIKLLKNIRKKQNEQKLFMGEKYYTEQNLVFCNDDGTPMNPQGVTRKFKQVAKSAGFPDMRLHDLRHTHASLLLSKNISPKVIQERLGHKNISQTLDTYSHVSPKMQREAAEKIQLSK